ncbi:MAG: glycosyltransferase family 2 protein [Apibacter sp.]|uniref:glycosyltransferase family 2 protein n=1 Tax=Apibacter sp. TaxID=2023709 RepID=UPI0025DC630C|nr:glycosyltransferase family 2 protein [Apibacter sp.]MCT6869358.1 glycosyltransferase family 2 protein [Apibacter sp.]
MAPIVSVIMAAYNAEKHISASIESIINQTFNNFELLVINDGSTDNTQSIVKEYCKKDSRIILLNNDKNLFVIKSRNKGIEKAKGKYIAILDSDDLALPNRLEYQVKYLENNPDIFLIGSSAYIIDENDKVENSFIAPTGYEKLKNNINKNNLIYHSTVMFRNENVFYREKMIYCEDYDLILRLFSEGKKIDNLSDILISYRQTSNSLSKTKNRLVQWLFINKARFFYNERLSTGKDSYESFDPKSFTQIYNINYPIIKDDCLFALKICLYRRDRETMRFLLKKYQKNYPISLYFIFYYLVSENKSIFSILGKFFSKI